MESRFTDVPDSVDAQKRLAVDVDVIVEAVLPTAGDPERLADLVRFACLLDGNASGWSVAVVLTDNGRLQALHREFMGIDEPTDVMTFPSEPAPQEHGNGGGDIVISVERAAAQAGDFSLSAWEEVRFLAVHGVLHLCGWDDQGDDARARMLARQRGNHRAIRSRRKSGMWQRP